MEAAANCRSFHGALGFQESYKVPFRRVLVAGKLFSTLNQNVRLKGVAKASSSTTPSKLDAERIAVPSDNKGPFSVFPDGFERLVMEVCDETEVAEVKVKVGEYEMHLKRNVDAPVPPPSIISPTVAPPIPSEPMVAILGSTSPTEEASEKSSPKASNYFANVSSSITAKLAALEASGSDAFVTISSPGVGSFRSGRTVKGKKQRPCCKKGDMINEGQVIGYVDQFGSELPVKSDVAGEVLKVLFEDGEAVGYGDPLVAVLPSFHGIASS